MSRPTAIYAAQGSRRSGRCGYCRERVTWVILAARGAKRLALVESPVLLAEQRDERGITAEVFAWDQLHRCQASAAAKRRRSVTPPAPASTSAPRTPTETHAYAAFTPERLAELRARITGASSQEKA